MVTRFICQRSALAFLLIFLVGGLGSAQTTYADPQGRFVIDLPEGWMNKPLVPAPKNKDAVSVFEGEGTSFLVAFNPGVDDLDKLMGQVANQFRSLQVAYEGDLTEMKMNGHPARWGMLKTPLDPGMVFLWGSVVLGRDGAYLVFTTRREKLGPMGAKIEKAFQSIRLPGELVSGVADLTLIKPAPLEQTSKAQPNINYGDSSRLHGDYARAIAYYSEAIELDPRSVEAYLKRAWTYLDWEGKPDYDKALADAAKVIELEPANKLAHFARAKVYLQKARAAEKAKNRKEAQELFDKALSELTLARGADFNSVKLFPNYRFFFNHGSLELLVDTAHAYHGKGDLDRALAAFSDAYESDPPYSLRVDVSLEKLFSEYDKQKRAIDVGDAPRALVLLGKHYVSSSPDLAIRHLTRALGLAHDNGLIYDAYTERSVAHANKGDYVSAIADADNAIKVWDSAWAYENRAEIYVRWGNYNKAISDYTEAIRIQKKNIKKAVSYDNYDLARLYDLYNKRGAAHVRNGSYDRGIADFLEAEKDLLPGQGKAKLYRFVASIYQLKGDAKNADKYLRKAQAQESEIKK
jgi:tetratricopeptide (TPR) repeat protein